MADNEVSHGLALLAASAVNRRGLGTIEEPYLALLAAGCSPGEVQSAWDARQRDAREIVTGDNYMPNLAKWLLDDGPTGASAMIYAARSMGAQAPESEIDHPALTQLSLSGQRVYGYRIGHRVQGILLDRTGKPIPVGQVDAARGALAALAAGEHEGRVA